MLSVIRTGITDNIFDFRFLYFSSKPIEKKAVVRPLEMRAYGVRRGFQLMDGGIGPCAAGIEPRFEIFVFLGIDILQRVHEAFGKVRPVQHGVELCLALRGDAETRGIEGVVRDEGGALGH